MKFTHSSNRINNIAKALELQTYLEIGVWDGRTLLNVEIPNRVGVDPAFKFDTAKARNANIELHEIDSDAYFRDAANAATQFDFIFIDGLHTFEQVLRDFCASQAYSHTNTIWLIDDVYPNDVFSAWPNHYEAVQFRREAGLDGIQWHGDVYKLVYFIHDYFPSFSYATISDGVNRQTLVWREPRGAFSPIMPDLRSIENMSYFQMRHMEEVYNFMTASKACDLVVAKIRARS